MATSTAIFDVEIVSNQLFEEIGKREARARFGIRRGEETGVADKIFGLTTLCRMQV
jgi:hypothetical protein